MFVLGSFVLGVYQERLKGIICDFFIFTLEQIIVLKEYYEIVGESCPLSAFFPTHGVDRFVIRVCTQCFDHPLRHSSYLFSVECQFNIIPFLFLTFPLIMKIFIFQNQLILLTFDSFVYCDLYTSSELSNVSKINWF